jgi:peptide/nickel transport system permease protein
MENPLIKTNVVMFKQIVGRLQETLFTLWLITIISFVLMQLMPGDPVKDECRKPHVTPLACARLRRDLGLDQPLWGQYIRWLTGVTLSDNHLTQSGGATFCYTVQSLEATLCDTGCGLLRLCLGYSFKTRRAVPQEIYPYILRTLELTGTALLIGLTLGILLGLLSAVWYGSVLDIFTRWLAVLGRAVPAFWLGIMLIYFFGVYLQWLPTGGAPQTFGVIEHFRHLLLPAGVLALGWIAQFSRLMRVKLLDQMGLDYIRTARAKGVGEQQIWVIHAGRNALIPVATILSEAIIDLLAGAVAVEWIFAWQGVGYKMVDTIRSQDYPVAMGLIVMAAMMAIGGNLLADLLYHFIDPRIKPS